MIKSLLKPQKLKKIKRKKKSERQKWTQKNDSLHSLTIRTRDNFKCQKEGCNASGNHMHCAHIFTRSRLSTRWNLDNAITLCYYHHLLWAHREPVEFTLWCIERLGKKKFEELRKKSIACNEKIDENRMKEIHDELKQQIKEFERCIENKVF
jgi:hypothetical protein